ncbi:MAG: STAS domain-containing protein [Thermoanaerobaculaceae bacterium]|jgi:anti-sigma B factor antagonist|nr:STAS domain-containing protein [Thermoanaerobaculaceae bacterium]
MQLKRREEQGVTVLEVQGTIKLGESAQQFTRELESIFRTTKGGVLLDLSEIDYVDSTGIGELVGHLQKFSQAQRKMVLFRPHKRIESLLKLTRLDTIFPVFWEREEAYAFLAS